MDALRAVLGHKLLTFQSFGLDKLLRAICARFGARLGHFSTLRLLRLSVIWLIYASFGACVIHSL